MPYEVDIEVNNNGYENVNINTTDLLTRYSAITINESGEYVTSSIYTTRQGKLYKADNQYYIYLLQDQKIEGRKVYDKYNNGKAYNDTTGISLPDFEIPYYQMQYYYTINNIHSAHLYEMATLDNDHKTDARKKLTETGATEILDATDWKYSYCNTNEDLTNIALKVYWYRNIVNVELSNLLDSKSTFNGYALVIEHEQVTLSLQEHTKYNLVIYAQDDEVYRYVTYGFNDISKLQSGKYDYTRLSGKTEEELDSMGVIKKETNILPIYFGNTIEVQAVDQSKDHSMDEFVGYRFDSYNYLTFSKSNSKTNLTLEEFDNYTNDGIDYSVNINLQNYEHELNGNTTNYFNDKDTLKVNVVFGRITYRLNYRVTDNDNQVESKYGSIRFDYKTDFIENYQFAYVLTIDNLNNLKSRMKVRLGSELYEWRLVNPYTTNKLTEDQLCEILLNATFLRTNLYLNISDKPLTQYPSQAEQTIADMNAVCGDIPFAIDVKVKLLTEDTNIREYRLSDSELNKLFNIKQGGVSVNTVSIDQEYTIQMLTKQEEDTYLYYYQDGQRYAVRSLYLGYSLSHSTNLMVNEFGYPVTTLSDIPMSVTTSLLDGSVNYTQ